MQCYACGHENRAGRKFCAECGNPLALACPTCGAANEPGERFCGECGSRLEGEAPAPKAVPAVERRLVSVLFADLVGFTSLSESHDAEDVRDLLSRYFETARSVIERYGGTLEKFIGDAVMAVWGAPAAQEDDAERAVRAALELVDAVAALDDRLAARAGVLTGEAAVTVGAEGQGMVAGDLVNTASRVQSEAEPGTVLVGETTRRASEAAIVYRDAGSFELKGKAEPAPLWQALRVAAARGGGLRADGLEAPFVGRDRELRLVKELFHASAEQGTAHLISIVGIAGIGKSRLAWELYKYLDGLTQAVLWHRGRCLAYGEGVTYWALAEMVRSRAEIREGEEPAAAREKLRASLEQFVPDAEERDWIEPRLAQLLGLEEGAAGEQEQVFGAWRLFVERLAERDPVVLVFEDVQWADAALLEFVDHLLEWSRNHAILVVALARPDLADRHPHWPGVKRNATMLALEPLSDEAMTDLLDGLVPGLPADSRQQILARAEGVPLYAVETVRILLDRGLIERDGDAYRVTGPIESLAVPETLHALIAARLDGLAPEERLVLQDAAVLGKTFTTAGLAALTGRDEVELEPVLASMARKEIVGLQTDPRSPERGHYGFLQDLLRQVAYETLARPERKARHLAAAAHLRTLGDELELAEVVAAHYLAAHELDPDAPDAPGIRRKSVEMLVRAGERAASLAAAAEAQRSFERALELTDEPREQAELHERAGRMARLSRRFPEARTHFEHAIAIFEAAGSGHAAARVAAALGEALSLGGSSEEGLATLERAFAVLAQEEPDADVATLAAQLGRFLMLSGRGDEALERLELALDAAEALRLPEVLSQALNTKGTILHSRGRREEGRVLLRSALEVALEHDLADAALRAYNNLAYITDASDRMREVVALQQAQLELAQRVGDRAVELTVRESLAENHVALGEWEAALAEATALADEAGVRGETADPAWYLLPVYAHRGDLDEARRLLDAMSAARDPGWVQGLAAHFGLEALFHLAERKPAEALAAAERALAYGLNPMHGITKLALADALEAAAALGDEAKLDELLARIGNLPPGQLTPLLQALGARYGARRASLRNDAATAEAGFAAAARIFEELERPVELGATLVDHAELLVSEDRAAEAESLLAGAEEIFGRLAAKPWLERAARCRAAANAAAAPA
jgi:class 3 adenylate cyclase/tetratricopeptide (TPR) repeat protein